MYDELLKRLREAAIVADSGNEISESLYSDILQAADAVEGLIAKLNHADDQIDRLVEAAEARRVMAEYHVGCCWSGAFAIYAGTLNSKNKNLWQNKSEVTDEATSAVAQYLLQENKTMRFAYKGKKYKLCVVEEEEGGR